MIIKLQKKHANFILSLLLVLALSLLTLNKEQYTIAMHDGYEYFMSLDPGFSSARNLSALNFIKEFPAPLQEKIISMISSIPAIIKYKMVGGKKRLRNLYRQHELGNLGRKQSLQFKRLKMVM